MPTGGPRGMPCVGNSMSDQLDALERGTERGEKPRILVSGATGYVGGRLAPRLLEAGYRVRALVRGDAARLAGRSWAAEVEIAVGDALQPGSLAAAMAGIDVAYYLIHNMRAGGDFQKRDVQSARNFAAAAEAAGVKRLIFLGRLGDPDGDRSKRLLSRQVTGRALREAGVPVTEFRAAAIVGSGSLAFETVRHLAELLPVMVCPHWVFTRTQPIAIGDVLDYLIAALETPESAREVIEIGGANVLTYRDMLLRYAAIRGLRRRIIRLPVLTPRLSSYWLHWMTPIPADIARPLIDGLRFEVIVQSQLAGHLFPQIKPVGYEAAVKQALRRIEEGQVETIWSDALASSRGDIPPVYLTEEQGMFIERRHQSIQASTAAVYRAFTRLGGRRGWPVNWSWRLRGAVDRLLGGVGMRRGRRHPEDLRIGEALDFWRVEAVESGRLIRLRAEMKVPGLAWLQFEARERAGGGTDLAQTAFFAPKGFTGLLYWYLLYPIHAVIFSKMVTDIGREAEQLALSQDLRQG
jgi:uncharacterized protein YbjT (DUF2867 family)